MATLTKTHAQGNITMNYTISETGTTVTVTVQSIAVSKGSGAISIRYLDYSVLGSGTSNIIPQTVLYTEPSDGSSRMTSARTYAINRTGTVNKADIPVASSGAYVEVSFQVMWGNGDSEIVEKKHADETRRYYTVAYDANGGTGAPAGFVKREGEEVAVTAVSPRRDLHTFEGWTDEPDGSGRKFSQVEGLPFDGTAKWYSVFYNERKSYDNWRYSWLYPEWGDTYTLYAQWAVQPRVSDIIDVYRTSAGQTGENGFLETRPAPDDLGGNLCVGVHLGSSPYGRIQLKIETRNDSRRLLGTSTPLDNIISRDFYSNNGSNKYYDALVYFVIPLSGIEVDERGSVTVEMRQLYNNEYFFYGEYYTGNASDKPTSSYSPVNSVTAELKPTAYHEPRISDLEVERCDADGQLSDDGDRALVSFSWAFYRAPGHEDPRSITVAMDGHEQEIPFEGDSGTYSGIFPYEVPTDEASTFEVKIADELRETAKSAVLPVAYFTMDLLGDHDGMRPGRGVSFGAPATAEGLWSHMPSYFADDVEVRGGHTLSVTGGGDGDAGHAIVVGGGGGGDALAVGWDGSVEMGPRLSFADGTFTGTLEPGRLVLQDGTSNAAAFDTAPNPLIEFRNVNGDQNGRLMFTDYDVVNPGATLAWVTDQPQSWLMSQYVRATEDVAAKRVVGVQQGGTSWVAGARGDQAFLRLPHGTGNYMQAFASIGASNGAWVVGTYGTTGDLHFKHHTTANINSQTNEASRTFVFKTNGGTANFLREDGSWAAPPNTTYPTAITNITRSGTTFTATRANGTTFTFTQQDNNTNTANVRAHTVSYTSGVQKNVKEYSYKPSWTHTSGYSVWSGLYNVNSNHNTAMSVSHASYEAKVTRSDTSTATLAEVTVTVALQEIGVYT